MPKRRSIRFLSLLLCLWVLIPSPTAAPRAQSIVPPPPAQALAPLPVAAFRAAPEVGRAIAFILSLQPEGTYILSREGVDGVVPMDLAHAALALCQAGHLREAEAALDWLLALQTRSGEAGSVAVREVDEETITIDYAGAWYDHYQVDGSPKVRMTRGRGEAVGLTLIALATVVRADPAYAAHVVAGEPVVAYVNRAAGYLRQPALQKADGRFHHRPDYQVSFGEEASRMGLGLRLAGELLASAGPAYAREAREAREAPARQAKRARRRRRLRRLHPTEPRKRAVSST